MAKYLYKRNVSEGRKMRGRDRGRNDRRAKGRLTWIRYSELKSTDDPDPVEDGGVEMLVGAQQVMQIVPLFGTVD